MMLLGLLGKLGVVVTAVTVSTVAGPMIAKQFTSSNEITYDSGGEKCLYFPIKRGDANNKLFVCKKKDNNVNPVFKWLTKDGARENVMQEITALSWQKKSHGTNDFELEVTLKQEASEPKIIKEDGDYNYVTGVSIKNMETNCTFKSVEQNRFILLCQEDISIGTKKHEIPVNFY